jgi:hypothetical protein
VMAITTICATLIGLVARISLESFILSSLSRVR